jgi:hypothetical protein
MTGNFAPRNSWNTQKQTTMAERNKTRQRAVRPVAHADYLRVPSACEDRGRRMAMSNSCKELVMSMEKHQPQGRVPVAAYCRDSYRRPGGLMQ